MGGRQDRQGMRAGVCVLGGCGALCHKTHAAQRVLLQLWHMSALVCACWHIWRAQSVGLGFLVAVYTDTLLHTTGA